MPKSKRKPKSDWKYWPLISIAAVAVGVGAFALLRGEAATGTLGSALVGNRPTVRPIDVPVESLPKVESNLTKLVPGAVMPPVVTFSTSDKSVQMQVIVITRSIPRVEAAELVPDGAALLILPDETRQAIDLAPLGPGHRVIYVGADDRVMHIAEFGKAANTPPTPYRMAMIVNRTRPIADEIAIGDVLGRPENLPSFSPPQTVMTPVIVTPPPAYPVPAQEATPRPTRPAAYPGP